MFDVHDCRKIAALGQQHLFAGERHAADFAGGVAADRFRQGGVVAHGQKQQRPRRQRGVVTRHQGQEGVARLVEAWADAGDSLRDRQRRGDWAGGEFLEDRGDAFDLRAGCREVVDSHEPSRIGRKLVEDARSARRLACEQTRGQDRNGTESGELHTVIPFGLCER